MGRVISEAATEIIERNGKGATKESLNGENFC